MIELAILMLLYRRLADVAQRRGRARAWGWLAVGLWIVGELLGLAIAILARAEAGGTYLSSLFCAALGGAVGAYVVSRLEVRVPIDTSAFD